MLRRVTFDALIVLGCRVNGGKLAHAALRRVERAALAYREQGAALVIASGGKTWQGSMEAEVFARGLIERGVPPACISLERESLTTRGNARGVARMLGERGAGQLGLVTCDWHMRRALRAFRLAGLTAVAVPAPSPARPLPARLGRYLRERASQLFDQLLARVWFRP
jgi:uncharacterized SAM-binding protein YcdF (DUF218 family)